MVEAARRAETGLGQMTKACPGFEGYYVFDCGDGTGGSVTLFQSREEALAAHEMSLKWIQSSLAELIQSEPEVTMGEILVALRP